MLSSKVSNDSHVKINLIYGSPFRRPSGFEIFISIIQLALVLVIVGVLPAIYQQSYDSGYISLPWPPDEFEAMIQLQQRSSCPMD
ncbi:MAG: hypothetical protein GY694_09755, partial [Gammaproteobacteria bacterium]|nr:hypothetical protein [Gammaproteobacteria bacterium]